MNRSFVVVVVSTTLVLPSTLLLPLRALAGDNPAPDECVYFDENCAATGTSLGLNCGEGDHAVPKKTSNIVFGANVVSATLTQCKTGTETVVTATTDLCSYPDLNDNVCNIELTLAAPHVECGATPPPICMHFPEASLKWSDSDDDAKDKLVWKMEGGGLTAAEFGNPPAGQNSYALCIYDAGVLVLQAKAHAGLRWKAEKNAKGYGYKGRKGDPGGISKIKLKAAGENTNSSTFVLRKGPLPPLADNLQLQLIDGAGRCFEGTL